MVQVWSHIKHGIYDNVQEENEMLPEHSVFIIEDNSTNMCVYVDIKENVFRI